MNRRDEIAANLSELRSHIPSHVTLICVTKTFPVSDVEILKTLGEENFGENRTSELEEKAAAVSGRWHFQGQIQSNKLKALARWADVVHSLDDRSHCQKLDRYLDEVGRKLFAFIQVSLDGRVGRGGALPSELAAIADSIIQSRNIELMGLMAVAPLGEEPDSAFSRLHAIHQNFITGFPMATALSAGMSGDFQSAISHGATHIRIGSQILGSRNLLG